MDREALLRRLASELGKVSGTELTFRLCDAARRIMGADGASVTVNNDSPGRVTLCATDDDAATLENLQDLLQQGPCFDAYRSGRPVIIAVEDAAARWPQFTLEAALQTEAHTLFAVPMHAVDVVVGVLSLYRRYPGALDEPIEVAAYLSDALAAALLADPSAYDKDQAGSPWSNRAPIHQATGMVVYQLGLPPDDALAILRAHAYAIGTDLASVAAAVINREITFTPGGDT